ncbi:PAS domain-containing protein [Pseudidiomarina halophila]|uniref:PAS domain-containing protein n=1 Tax=Pseudidiomarina halophila TaxID=1449799 RepID=UPI00361EE45F
MNNSKGIFFPMFKAPVQLSDLEYDVHKELFSYWDKNQGSKPMPSRTDFDPIDVPGLLTHISMVDIEPETGRYKYRLVGSETVTGVGEDYTGRYLDELPVMSGVIERYNWMLENKIPYLYRGQFIWSKKDYLDYCALNLPFSDDGVTVNIIMTGVVCFLSNHTERQYPRKR